MQLILYRSDLWFLERQNGLSLTCPSCLAALTWSTSLQSRYCRYYVPADSLLVECRANIRGHVGGMFYS
jgi:hypothetical protein